MSSTVILRLSAAGSGSDPDTQNCLLTLSPSIWVNQGGWWGARTGTISRDNGMGGWRQSRVDQGMIVGVSRDDDSDQVFTLQGVSSPMTVNKTGTGTLLKAGNQMPDGPIRWQITQIASSGGGGSTLSGDGDDDD